MWQQNDVCMTRRKAFPKSCLRGRITAVHHVLSFLMTALVQKLIQSFESLSLTEKHEAAVEILRRVSEEGDLPEATLTSTADELFCALDDEEAAHAAR